LETRKVIEGLLLTYEGGGEDLEVEVRKIMEGAEVLGEVEMAEVREMIIRKRQEI
jgi:hypothetical protein